MWLALTSAAVAGKYDDLDADIEASARIAAPVEAVYSYLLDLHHLQAITPSDCVGLWQLGERTYGEGANALVRYDMALMHRRLPMTLVRAVAPLYIDFDHVGPKGFVTRWHFESVDGGTQVSIETPLTTPPAPFKGYYFNVVKPEWEGCYARMLDGLSRAAGAPSSP